MTEEQMILIKQRLRCIWTDIIPSKEALSAWYDTMRPYSFNDIENATIDYMRTKPYKPTPADIISMIPTKPAQSGMYKRYVKQYETLPDGRQVPVIKCKRCRDTGLITWRDDDQVMWSHPCNCAAAYIYYSAKYVDEWKEYNERATK